MTDLAADPRTNEQDKLVKQPKRDRLGKFKR